MKRAAFAFVLSAAAMMIAPTAGSAGAATTGTTYAVSAAVTTPRFCTTDVCFPGSLSGYTYTGDGTCSANCVGWPADPIRVTLSFTVARTFPPSPCKMKTGTGTLDAQWPTDPTIPSAHGTFSFRSRDGKTVRFSGTIDSSTVSVLSPGELLRGFVTYPPSPCLGGTAAASITFGG